MKYIQAIVLMSFIASCHNNGSNEQDLIIKNNNDTIKDYNAGTSNPEEALSSCYEKANGKDTVFLSVFGSSKIITGALNYHYNEKDNNNGTIRGIMHGDTLIADYIFMSEGKATVREVVFLKQDDNFIEGYGETADEHGKTVFKDRNAISFSGLPLQMVDCNRY